MLSDVLTYGGWSIHGSTEADSSDLLLMHVMLHQCQLRQPFGPHKMGDVFEEVALQWGRSVPPCIFFYKARADKEPALCLRARFEEVGADEALAAAAGLPGTASATPRAAGRSGAAEK